MNIHDISHGQRGYHNAMGMRVGYSNYAAYVRFCMGRRPFQRKTGKPLYRSETSVAKQRAKANAYQHKLRKRGSKRKAAK